MKLDVENSFEDELRDLGNEAFSRQGIDQSGAQ